MFKFGFVILPPAPLRSGWRHANPLRYIPVRSARKSVNSACVASGLGYGLEREKEIQVRRISSFLIFSLLLFMSLSQDLEKMMPEARRLLAILLLPFIRTMHLQSSLILNLVQCLAHLPLTLIHRVFHTPALLILLLELFQLLLLFLELFKVGPDVLEQFVDLPSFRISRSLAFVRDVIYSEIQQLSFW